MRGEMLRRHRRGHTFAEYMKENMSAIDGVDIGL